MLTAPESEWSQRHLALNDRVLPVISDLLQSDVELWPFSRPESVMYAAKLDHKGHVFIVRTEIALDATRDEIIEACWQVFERLNRMWLDTANELQLI